MSDAIRVKTQHEIHCLRMAGAIAEAAHWEVCQALRPGMSDLEISGIAANACYKLCDMHRRTIRLRRAQHAHRQALEAR
jgi:Xaa-Pro aminopeptidase